MPNSRAVALQLRDLEGGLLVEDGQADAGRGRRSGRPWRPSAPGAGPQPAARGGPVKACGLVTSWTRWRSMREDARARRRSSETTWSSQIFSTSVRAGGVMARSACSVLVRRLNSVPAGAAETDAGGRWRSQGTRRYFRRACPCVRARVERRHPVASRVRTVLPHTECEMVDTDRGRDGRRARTARRPPIPAAGRWSRASTAAPTSPARVRVALFIAAPGRRRDRPLSTTSSASGAGPAAGSSCRGRDRRRLLRRRAEGRRGPLPA